MEPWLPVLWCLLRHRGWRELYQDKDLGLWPARTKAEFPFHSQPLSASHLCVGTGNMLEKKPLLRMLGENHWAREAIIAGQRMGWGGGPTAGVGTSRDLG